MDKHVRGINKIAVDMRNLSRFAILSHKQLQVIVILTIKAHYHAMDSRSIPGFILPYECSVRKLMVAPEIRTVG